MYMNIPVDLAGLDVRAIIGLEPEVDADGVQKRDYEGLRLWALVVTCKLGRDYQTIKIQFGQDNDPDWDGKTMPVVQGLSARPWGSINKRGKLNGGVMWTAKEVGFKAEGRTATKVDAAA